MTKPTRNTKLFSAHQSGGCDGNRFWPIELAEEEIAAKEAHPLRVEAGESLGKAAPGVIRS